jgi:hypothetical protein
MAKPGWLVCFKTWSWSMSFELSDLGRRTAAGKSFLRWFMAKMMVSYHLFTEIFGNSLFDGDSSLWAFAEASTKPIAVLVVDKSGFAADYL